MGWGGFCGVVRCGRRCGRAKSHGYKRGAYIDVVGWLGDAWVREGGILFALQFVLLERSSFPSARRANGPGAGTGLLRPALWAVRSTPGWHTAGPHEGVVAGQGPDACGGEA